MKRLLSILTIVALMATLVVATVVPASATTPDVPTYTLKAQYDFDPGHTNAEGYGCCYFGKDIVFSYDDATPEQAQAIETWFTAVTDPNHTEFEKLCLYSLYSDGGSHDLKSKLGTGTARESNPDISSYVILDTEKRTVTIQKEGIALAFDGITDAIYYDNQTSDLDQTSYKIGLQAKVTGTTTWKTYGYTSATNFKLQIVKQNDDDLYVIGDTTTRLTVDDLNQFWQNEGSHKYTYSTYSTFPTYEKRVDCYGPTVAGVLSAAGIDVSTLADNDVISFIGKDEYTSNITVKQFKETRYYFPNGESTNNFTGTTSAQTADKVEVPYIIDISDPTGSTGIRNTFGQLNPQDQQLSDCCQNLKEIKIIKAKATTYDGLTPSIASGSTVAEGDKLYFDLDFTNWNSGSNRYAWVYYTVSTDGTEPADPTMDDILYNHKQFSTNNDYNTYPDKFNYYTFTDADKTIIKVAVFIRGYDDPVVTTLTYEAQKYDVDTTDTQVAVAIDDAAKETILTAVNDKLDDTQKAEAATKGLTAKVEIADVKEADLLVKEKAGFEKAAGDDTIALYLDIDVNYYIGDEKVGSITDMDAIEITIDIPEEYQGHDNYAIIREHDGEYEVINCTLSEDGKSLTFKSGKFSTYALTYSDDVVEEKTVEETEKVVNTNDETVISAFVGTTFLGLLGIAVIDKKRKYVK